MMSPTNESLRRAAVLVASLEPAAADELLDRMTPEQAGLIRRSIVELREVDVAEEAMIIGEFLSHGGRAAPYARREVAAVDEPPRSSRRFAENEEESPVSFDFLHDADDEVLSELLAGESPQVAAVVASHLPPEGMARALAGLSEELQADIVRRLARLDETDPSVLREVERSLQRRYRRRFATGRREAGISAVKQILNEASVDVRRSCLTGISRRDPRLAAELTDPAVRFEELIRLTDESLCELFEMLPEEIAVPALAGADLDFVRRVMGVLPRILADRLQSAVETLGPTRLSDVDAAQEETARRVGEWASYGRLRWNDDESAAATNRGLAAAA